METYEIDVNEWMYDFSKQKKSALDSSDKLLIQKCIRGIAWRYPDTFDQEKRDKLKYELGIIIQMGFSNYFLVVQDFLDVGRRIGYMPDERIAELSSRCYDMSIQEMNDFINEDQTYPGLTIGPGRGSAVGSEATYLLGITSVDPFKYSLLFERFLNPERVTMPDIDSDLSKSEYIYGVRDIVIEYVKKKYGHKGVCGITTPSTLAAKAAIRNMARILGKKSAAERTKDIKSIGTVKKISKDIADYYLHLADVLVKLVPNQPKIKFNSKVVYENQEHTLDELIRGKINEIALKEAQNNADNRSSIEIKSDLTEILNIVEQVEGCNINYSTHACGEIISDNQNIGAYAPMMMDPNSGLKIQMDAEMAEELGFLKMDFLGLKTLNLITMIIRKVYKNYGIKIDVLNLPEDPDVFKYVFSAGKTNSVFQFESDGMKNMLMRFEPESLEDLILLVACFRPGPMQYLDGIIARKHGQNAEENAVTRIAAYHERFRNLVAPTYLAIVYQEQVMQAAQILADYTLGHADVLRRAMGHKKEDVLAAEQPAFVQGCIKNGVKEKDAIDLFSEVIDFAKYSFNKSHAATYAELAYITAWLKYHYAAEFYASALNFVKFEKYASMIAEAKTFGVTMTAPDINKSHALFTEDQNKVYFGFSGIKGIGKSMDDFKGKYTSFADFVEHSNVKDSDIQKLILVGAFDCFCTNRQALMDILPDYLKQKEIIKSKQRVIALNNQIISDIDQGHEIREKYNIKTKSLPTKAKLKNKIQYAEQDIQDAKSMLYSINIPVSQTYESLADKLEKEKALLGMYISGHPLDPYGSAADYNCEEIASPKAGKIRLFGIIQNLCIRKRKADGKEMAFFDLEDRTGSIHVCCFTEAYQHLEFSLSDGKVVTVLGEKRLIETEQNSVAEDENSEDEIAVTYELIVDKALNAISEVTRKKDIYRINIEGDEDIRSIQEKLSYYRDDNGYKIILYNKTEECFLWLTMRVSDAIFKSGLQLQKMTV